MGALNLAEWQKLPISLSELCINTTLRCGQSFRWRKNDLGVWSIALHNRILSLHQDKEYLYYRSIRPSQSHIKLQAPPTPPSSKPPSLPEAEQEIEDDSDDTLELIRHYFNLSPNLTDLYAQWSANDANFARRAPAFTGIRILQQDSWECLVGFICSSNNNIIRISQMVHKLCNTYGPLIGHLKDPVVPTDENTIKVEGEEEQETITPYHDFPTPQALSVPGVEQTLRNLGFGYRAKYIATTARLVAAKELVTPNWLDTLRNPESPILGTSPSPSDPFPPSGRPGYLHAHTSLLSLQGVGPKVADCVCLMGLGWGEAVPVDTHVWQIAQRDYKFGKGKHASLTKVTYDAIGAKFRALWGKEAGWAQSILFTANLRAFSERVVQGKKTEGVVKREDDGDGEEEEERVIKREYVDEEEETKVLEVKEKKTRAKRRRRN
ncbi:Putative HhH-GPD domain, DNA glycosylase, 8-oxoguanine DNA glycosylase [Septoria linicola]|uniref:DNA-(apurinic or apyrimidinic site) lyase n=1 Tax=Septoria linicola TaxID=215465 RepID=A0A9Q9EL55_9PEZI|nr:Putative HhH-GPD domain, DNA glycosylase, 8-oxoguanine DNA glycosylase [Septoria linicola]